MNPVTSPSTTASDLLLSQTPQDDSQSSSQDFAMKYINRENPKELINTIIKLKEARRGCSDKIEQLNNIFDELQQKERDYEQLQLINKSLKRQLE